MERLLARYARQRLGHPQRLLDESGRGEPLGDLQQGVLALPVIVDIPRGRLRLLEESLSGPRLTRSHAADGQGGYGLDTDLRANVVVPPPSRPSVLRQEAGG